MTNPTYGAPADLSRYATHFNEIETEEHEVVFNHNAIHPISELRETTQNVSNTPSEHQMSTGADTDDNAFIETTQRGEYSSGFQAEAGLGVRLPQLPTGDSTVRWGYYETDDNGDPLNGFYYGADSVGLFVARANGGTIEKVYQENWNRDTLGEGELNPSNQAVDLADGYVFQIAFKYYGYGPIEMRLLLDDNDPDSEGHANLVTAHTFFVDGSTSLENTNLPIRTEIDSGGTSNDALDFFLGGRQFSIVGKRATDVRTNGHYLDELMVDDTKWHHAISFQLKDGSGGADGAIDFRTVLGVVRRFYADTDANSYKWQIRLGATPDNPSWENPESAEDKPDETAFKVDTQSADVQDGSGDLTGVHIDSGVLAEGGNNEAAVATEEVDGEITGNLVVSLLFKATPSESGTVSEIYFKVGERW
jgi:hypothetical protein